MNNYEWACAHQVVWYGDANVLIEHENATCEQPVDCRHISSGRIKSFSMISR